MSDREMQDRCERGEREGAGYLYWLAEPGRILVQTHNLEHTYEVTLDAAGEMHCTCPDHQKRGGVCKHQYAIGAHRNRIRRLPELRPRLETMTDAERAERDRKAAEFDRIFG